MLGRLAVCATVLTLACGGRPAAPSAPQSITDALAQFLAAVKANDLQRMGQLWGTERGPASEAMTPKALQMRVTVIQKYLDHVGYRVVEGPVAPASGAVAFRTVRVELQREGCNAVLPIDLVRTRSGSWLVYDVHLESAGNPAAQCQPEGAGTRR